MVESLGTLFIFCRQQTHTQREKRKRDKNHWIISMKKIKSFNWFCFVERETNTRVTVANGLYTRSFGTMWWITGQSSENLISRFSFFFIIFFSSLLWCVKEASILECLGFRSKVGNERRKKKKEAQKKYICPYIKHFTSQYVEKREREKNECGGLTL